jgi:hypothetical protein
MISLPRQRIWLRVNRRSSEGSAIGRLIAFQSIYCGQAEWFVRPSQGINLKGADFSIGLKKHYAHWFTVDFREPVADNFLTFSLDGHAVKRKIDSGTPACAFTCDSQPLDLRQEITHVCLSVFDEPSDQVALLLGQRASNELKEFIRILGHIQTLQACQISPLLRM